MTPKEIDEIKELLHIYSTANNAKLEAKFDVIDYKLDSINDHLKIQNGRVSKSEQAIAEFITKFAVLESEDKDYLSNRVATCPQLSRIQSVEQDIVTKKEIKKYFVSTIGVIVVLLTIITAIINLV